MNKREAKRLACRCAYQLLNLDHNNEFLADRAEGEAGKLTIAWEELLEELERRGWPEKEGK